MGPSRQHSSSSSDSSLDDLVDFDSSGARVEEDNTELRQDEVLVTATLVNDVDERRERENRRQRRREQRQQALRPHDGEIIVEAQQWEQEDYHDNNDLEQRDTNNDNDLAKKDPESLLYSLMVQCLPERLRTKRAPLWLSLVLVVVILVIIVVATVSTTGNRGNSQSLDATESSSPTVAPSRPPLIAPSTSPSPTLALSTAAPEAQPSDMPSGNPSSLPSTAPTDCIFEPSACDDGSCGNCFDGTRTEPGCSCPRCECLVCISEPLCCTEFAWGNNVCINLAQTLCECTDTSSPA